MKISEALLKRFISGECTDEEKRFVENWLQSEETTDSGLSEKEISQMEQNLRQRFEKSHPSLLSAPTTKPWKQLAKYAAAIALFISAGAASYNYFRLLNQNHGTDIVVSWEGYFTYETQRGERPTITLPDGTTVQLNSNSQLKYPEHFTDTERVVFLQGHAHFDVVRNPDKPFMIFTEHSKTQVLGTSFDINTRQKSGETEVIVTSGKVSFSDKNQTDEGVTLIANDRGILSSNGTIAMDKVDASTLTAWTKNQLIFENQTLTDIMKIAEGWFDIDVVIEDSELCYKSFTYAALNPSLEEFLRFMGEVGNFEYRISNKEVAIFPSSREGK